LRLDSDALLGGLLYRAWRFRLIDESMLLELAGPRTVALLSGVERLGRASGLSLADDPILISGAEDQVENVRHLLESLITDARVALFKLAERVVVLRHAKTLPSDTRLRLARESLTLFAPLAGRLGIWRLKWALEDLAFRYLEPESYQDVARRLDGRREERERQVEVLASQLQSLLSQDGIAAEVSGRAKHIYSIWRKMHDKDLDVSEIYDVRALRVLVDTTADCYRALGVLHTSWMHLPQALDDYIANPKDNGYQSLHTAVVGPLGKILEVQIRTFEMHTEAEFGVCAHWSYKESRWQMPSERINWLRQLLEWYDDGGGEAGFETLLAQGGSDGRIYVSTPKGHVLDLPTGATAVDFAYRIHTEIGHRCRGAKVDGELVTLHTPLATGQRVEILTTQRAEPRLEWLSEHLGFVRTSRARAKVQSWFRRQSRASNASTGERIWAQARQRLALADGRWASDLVATSFGYVDVLDLHIALGRGELAVAEILRAHAQPEPEIKAPLPVGTDGVFAPGHISVGGQGWPLALGTCCQPRPGQALAGYLDESDAVIAHRIDCKLFTRLRDARPVRILALRWPASDESVGLTLQVRGSNRHGLLRDITAIAGEEALSMVGTRARLEDNASQVSIELDCKRLSLDRLSRLLDRLRQIPDVVDACLLRETDKNDW
jgi:GTP pyrophosphokinase